MKRITFLRTSSGALAMSLALAASAAPDSPAAGANRSNATGTSSHSGMSVMGSHAMGAGQITVATDDAEKHTDKKLTGQELKGADGKKLGKVHDFLVDGASGKAEYAVISSGGLAGMGDKMRLVPVAALQRSKEDEFTLSLDHSRWEAIPAFSDESLKSDEVAMSDSERRQIDGHFSGTGSAGAMSASSSPYTAGMTGHLFKASDLRGKDVKAGNQEIGSIEGLVLDLSNGQAHALFDGKSSFLGTSQKYLVPLNRFSLAGKREPATTTLTRADFESGSTASSAGTGSLPVAAAASSTTSGNAGATNPSATTDTSTTNSSATAGAVAQSSSPAAPTTPASPAASSTHTTKDTAVSMTGRDTQKEKSASSATTDAERTTQADILAHSDPSRSPGSSAAGTPPLHDSTTSQSTPPSDVNSGNITAGNSTRQTSSNKAAQSDADAKDTAPGYKNEQGADVATTGPVSSASKGTGADRDISTATNNRNSTASTSATSPSSSSATTGAAETGKGDSSGLATTSTPSRSTNAGGASQPGANPNSSSLPSTDPMKSPDSGLSPTGKNSSDQTPGSNGALITAAQAVRKALDDDESLSRVGVVVTPENGKLVLRGSVTSDQKSAIEEKAERAASGQDIDSQLTIK